jgi:uncharacterized protein YdeI (BOF family)
MRSHLTKEDVMVSVRGKIVGLVSCGFVLCLSLPNSALAINNFAEELNEVKTEELAGGQTGLAQRDEATLNGPHTIYGEVLQVKHDKYLVRKYNGDVIRVQIDNNTQVNERLTQGDRIVAKVDDQRHVLLIEPFE